MLECRLRRYSIVSKCCDCQAHLRTSRLQPETLRDSVIRNSYLLCDNINSTIHVHLHEIVVARFFNACIVLLIIRVCVYLRTRASTRPRFKFRISSPPCCSRWKTYDPSCGSRRAVTKITWMRTCEIMLATGWKLIVSYTW